MDTRICLESICRDCITIWTTFAIRLWASPSKSVRINLRYSKGFLTNFSYDQQTTPKLAKKARSSLDVAYSHLGGKAFSRDKKGRVTKDDSSTSADLQAAGHMGDGGDYSAYVCYEFEIQ